MRLGSLFGVLFIAFTCSAFQAANISKSVLREQNEAPINQRESLNAYYAKNKIFPSNNPSPIDPIKENEVSSYLANNYGGSGWHMVSSSSKSVEDITGTIPYELDEYSETIQSAKNSAGISSTYIGCGRLALLNQFDYIDRAFNFIELGNHTSDVDYFENLATTVFQITPGIASESLGGSIIGLTGTYVSPSDFLDSAIEVCENYGMDQIEYIDPLNYQTTFPFNITGDYLINNSPSSTKLNAIKDSIDQGMPVVWWTGHLAPNPYINHYMNVYSYEKWASYSSGGAVTHYMFRLRMNWGESFIAFVDENVLLANNGGFIFFTPNDLHTYVNFTTLNLPSSFLNQESSIISPQDNVTEYYGRRAALKTYTTPDDYASHLTFCMSGRNGNYTQSYFGLAFNKEIASITFYLAKWHNDVFDSNDSLYLGVFGPGYSNSYPINLSLLSNDYYHPSRLMFSFFPHDTSIKELSLQLYSSAGQQVDSKRLSVSGISVIFEAE